MSNNCKSDILNLGQACKCDLGISGLSNCNQTFLETYPVGWSILQSILLFGWSVLVVWSGLSVVKMFTSSTVADSYKTLLVKRFHLVFILIVSLIGLIANFDILDQHKLFSSGIYVNLLALQSCFMLILLLIIGWHWLYIYDYAIERSLRRSNTSWGSDIELTRPGRQSKDRAGLDKYRKKGLAGTAVLVAFLIVIWLTVTIANLLVDIDYDSPVNWMFAVIMFLLYLLWIILFLAAGKRLGKSITFKSAAKWKLTKTSNRVLFSTIGFIASFFISSLIYFLLLPISDVFLFVALIIEQGGIIVFLSSEIQTYWTRLSTFPFVRWKRGRSISPNIESPE